MDLRPYQSKIIADVREQMMRGYRRVLIQLATGGGKTAIASHMIKSAHDKGMSTWFVCNREELIEQTGRTLYKLGLPFSFISAGYSYDPKKLIQVCSIQTLSRRLGSIKESPQMVFWDETRGIAAKSWSSVFHNFPKVFHIGLDATPVRLSGEPLSDYYQTMVNGPSIKWLIENNFLSDYKIFAPKVADFTMARTRMGDYVQSDIADIMSDKKILGNAVKEYQRRAMGKRNLVFCVNIEHSKKIRQEFLDAGISAEDVDGTMAKHDRKGVLKRFESGITKVVTSVDLVTAGFDLPAIECVTLERPTKSHALYRQMIGRGLRPFPGKDKLIILDHVNAYVAHGLPDDEYEYSLDGTAKRKGEKEKSVKMCEKCYFVFDSYKRVCPECGHEKEVERVQKVHEHTDDELQEIDRDAARMSARKTQGQAQTEEQLIELGRSRGYKRPELWARHIMISRAKKRGYHG